MQCSRRCSCGVRCDAVCNNPQASKEHYKNGTHYHSPADISARPHKWQNQGLGWRANEIIEDSYVKKMMRIASERDQAIEAYIRVYMEISKLGIEDLELVERTVKNRTWDDVTWFVRPIARKAEPKSAVESIVRNLRR